MTAEHPSPERLRALVIEDDPDAAEFARDHASPGARLLARIDPEAVGLRAAPFTAVFLASALGIALRPEIERYGLLAGTAVVVIAIQLIATFGRWDRWPRWWQYTLPLVQMACLAGLEAASLDTPSFFRALLFLPVVSLALQPSTVGVALGTIGTAALTLGAAAMAPGPLTDNRLGILVTLVVTTCATLVSVGVYAVTQRLRDRTAAGEALQRAQEEALRTVARQRDQLTDQAAALKDSQALLSSVVDATTEHLVLATDDRSRVLLCSPGAERVLGRTVDSLMGTDVVDLFEPNELLRAAGRLRDETPDGMEGEAALLQAAVGGAARGEPEHREATFVRSDGDPVPVDLLVTSRRRLDEPDAAGYLFVVTDLTESHERERLQDEFIGLVSHELRTPLASILGYTQLMQANAVSLSSDQHRYLAVVDRNANRLLRLVNDLLLSVQVVAGTFTLAAEEIDAADAVGESLANLEPSAMASGVTISYRPESPLRLVTDRQRLGQVVENLVTNAVSFSPRGGTVQVDLARGTATDGRRRALLTVTDDGPGMTAEEISQVTERFFRTENAQRKRVRGMGLGLSIVDAIVQAHGGWLAISSLPGAGTRIAVELPDLAA